MAKNQARSTDKQFNKIFLIFIKFGITEPDFIALVCWTIVILGSLLCDFHRPPEFYLSNKRNIFNVFFAKWSLAWTLLFLTPYMVLTYWIKSSSNLKVVSKNILRLVVAFVVWFGVTTVFEWIDHFSGDCEGSDFYSRKSECQGQGLVWTGSDISGHSFLLTFCSVIICEEIQLVRFWISADVNSKDKNTNKSKDQLACNVSSVMYICNCLLLILWLMLLVITSVYFHTTNSKLGGIIIALLAWLLTYRIYFPSKYFPGSPAEAFHFKTI